MQMQGGQVSNPSAIQKFISGQVSRGPHFSLLPSQWALLPCAALWLLLFPPAVWTHASGLGFCWQWFAVAWVAPTHTGTSLVDASLSCCPSAPWHCLEVQNSSLRPKHPPWSSSHREPGWSDICVCPVSLGRFPSPASTSLQGLPLPSCDRKKGKTSPY